MAYLAAVLRRHNCDTKILDCTAHYAHYRNKDIIDYCRDYSPDAIGILIMTTFATEAYQLVGELKPLGIPIIAGGAHPSLVPGEVIRNGVDIAFRGESEEGIVEFADYLRNRKKLGEIKGISYKQGSKILHNAPRSQVRDLDSLPFPDKGAYNLKDFAASDKELKNSLGIIITSRGCMGRCIFCSKTVSGSIYRFRSAENIAEELKQLKQKYGINSFLLVDDTINIIPGRLREICKHLRGAGIVWRCNARIDFMTKELLQEMKASGCTQISYGIESGDPDVLRLMRKGFTIDKAKQVVKWTHEAGIAQIVNFMFGFPFETEANIRNTINAIRWMEPYINAIQRGAILIPFPGTEVYETNKDKHSFAEWWLKPSKYLRELHSDEKLPLYKKVLFKDLGMLNKDEAFFDYSPRVIRQIRKAIALINRIIVRKKAEDLNFTSLRRLTVLIEIAVWALLALSLLAYKISPKLERRIIFAAYLLLRQSNLYLHRRRR
jgi:radical SAM superfamily enzyme YgiQ (UPF0313 family)